MLLASNKTVAAATSMALDPETSVRLLKTQQTASIEDFWRHAIGPRNEGDDGPCLAQFGESLSELQGQLGTGCKSMASLRFRDRTDNEEGKGTDV